MISRSPGDGHCLLHSILTSLTNQIGSTINLNSLKSQIFIETLKRAQIYSTYIPDSESLLSLLHKYMLQKKYDTSFGDILPNIIANTLRINLSIIDQSGNAFHKINVPPTVVNTSSTVALHRIGDHYNGLVGRRGNHRQQPRPVVVQPDRLSDYTNIKDSNTVLNIKVSNTALNSDIIDSKIDPEQSTCFMQSEHHPNDNSDSRDGRADVHRQQPRPVDARSDRPGCTKEVQPEEQLIGPVDNHRQQPRPVVDHCDQNNTNGSLKHSRILKYSASDLTQIREAANLSGSLKIKRDVRKKLFSNGIWKPRSGHGAGPSDNTPSPIPVRITNSRKSGHSDQPISNQSAKKQNIMIKTTPSDHQPGLNFNVCCLNAQSVVNKTDSISDYITTNDFDLVALTETWLQEGTPQSVLKDLVPDNYSIRHIPRPGGRRGGGIGIIYKSAIDISIIPYDTSYISFEHMGVKMCTKHKDIMLHIIYRPPPSQVNGITQQNFRDEWSGFIAGECTSSIPVVIMGDLNVHLDVASDPGKIFLQDTLRTAGLTQHVSEPTHKHGHILDVVITRDNPQILSKLQVNDPGICDRHNNIACDHKAVTFQLNIPKPAPVRKTVTFRRLNKIPSDLFKKDLADKLSSLNTNDSNIITTFNESAGSLIDKYAPSITKNIVTRKNIPYYNTELHDAKRLKRKLERKWRKTKSESDLRDYREASRTANKQLRQAKSKYYSGIIEEHSKDPKALFRVTNSLLGKCKASPLPPGYTPIQLAEQFSDYFINKVRTIRQAFSDSTAQNQIDSYSPSINSTLTSFSSLPSMNIKKIIANAPTKSCALDPLPTGLLKLCLEDNYILDYVCKMINYCVTNTFPQVFKSAIVIPLLKKPSLEVSNFKNYRPVSNLPFISKVVEKVIAAQLRNHLAENNLLDQYQSAYRSKHSTETALVKVQSDVINALDKGKAAALVLLDLSAAFDTIDHQVLLHRLKNYFGIKEKALAWFESYLINRSASVLVNGEKSAPQSINIGVPQGSVLGPILFTCYTTPLGRIIQHHGLQRHFYADDTQLYISFEHPTGTKDAVDTLEKCLEDVRVWMYQNFLKLNDDKTEFMILSKKQDNMEDSITIKIGQSTIHSVDHAKNLGVIFDRNLSMDKQIGNIRKQCYHQIHNIAQIRRFLSLDAIKSLVQANITSRLDYANGVLYGLPQKSIGKLQLVQNTAARLIVKTSRRAHITPILMDLHWLPVAQRIVYKILVLTYKSISEDAPQYLQDAVKEKKNSRTLRSSSQRKLDVPKYKLKTYGMRSFHVASAVEWNALPNYIRNADSIYSFKKHLKTHLFKSAYKL